MNHFLFLIFLTFALNASAQNYIVVDADKNTSQIFNYDDPQSYVSLLLWNRNYIGYLDPVYMQEVDVQKLTKNQRSELIEFIGQPGTIPLIDDDPESENFGNYLLVTLEGGMQAFVYDAPDTMYTDLKGISRIILEYNEGDAPLVDRVTQVTFCKKYDEKYVPVLRFFDNSILKMKGFQFFSEVETENLVSDKKMPEASYWQQLEDSVRRAGENYSINLDYFPYTSVFSLWTGLDHVPDSYKESNEMNDIYHNVYDDLERFTFDYWYGESLLNNYNFLEVILHDFDSVSYGLYQDDMPLIETDPDSPNFGEVMLVEDSLGDFSFVYADPEPFFKWVDFAPYKSYSIYSIVSTENGLESVLEKLIFTTKDESGEHLVLVHDPTEYWRNLVRKDLAPHKDWNEWYKAYSSALQNGKKYSRDSEKDRKAMNVSESFWYR